VENPQADPQPSGAGRRLDSWKEIASYLKRSVRSVQRWEAEEGMPVHRHLHDKRGSVYAFAEELDTWWKERGAMLAQQNGAAEQEPAADEPAAARPVELRPPPPRKPRFVWAVTGFTAALLTVGVVAWLSRNGSGTSSESLRPLPFKARDWVLVAGFENRTGEKLFDGTLDYALGRELSNSRYVSVVSRERVGDALRLMRKPLDTRLDASLAREVCLRDGEIRALLTGRVEKLGSKYLFSVELVDPRQGTALAGFSEESSRTNGSLAAMRRISDRVRAALGETPTPGTIGGRGLAKVTTSSLRALQLYSQADRLVTESDAAAEELLRQAITEDPHFASAYIHLAHAVHNQGRPAGDYVPYAETAFRLSETTTERERYFIRGSYYHLLGQREKAIAAYEALLALYPDHPWATGNLLVLYDRWKDFDRILEAEIREADARPGYFNLNFHAAYNIIRWKQQPTSRGEPYLSRARALVTPEVMENFSWEWAWLESLPFTERWAEGNLQEAAREVDRLAGKLDSLSVAPRDTLADETAHGYLTLGRLGTAERVARKISHSGRRASVLAHVCLARGDRVGLTRQLRSGEVQGYYRPWTWIPILEARVGLDREARGWLPKMEEGARKRGWADRREIVLGEIALEKGNVGEAIRRFEEAARLRVERFDWHGTLLAAESYATALNRHGQTARAIDVLERAQGQFQPFEMLGPYWQKNRLDLAKLYRSVGRVGEARLIESELLKRLALADADHPIVLELQRLQKAS
jgi:tetratricopeptide (TPR) repeat protein